MARSKRVKQHDLEGIERDEPVGIVIHAAGAPAPKPRISAFIWGGKVRPEPTLPFGRWKSTAV
ncbi:MAG: hypothetical protein ACLFRX_12165 [Gemmatimonadota bacterium]